MGDVDVDRLFDPDLAARRFVASLAALDSERRVLQLVTLGRLVRAAEQYQLVPDAANAWTLEFWSALDRLEAER